MRDTISNLDECLVKNEVDARAAVQLGRRQRRKRTIDRRRKLENVKRRAKSNERTHTCPENFVMICNSNAPYNDPAMITHTASTCVTRDVTRTLDPALS
jgi:hypothetical protein